MRIVDERTSRIVRDRSGLSAWPSAWRIFGRNGVRGHEGAIPGAADDAGLGSRKKMDGRSNLPNGLSNISSFSAFGRRY